MERISPKKLILHSHMGDDEAALVATEFYEKGVMLTDKPFFKEKGDKDKITQLFVHAAGAYRGFTLPPTKHDSVVHLVGFRHIHTQELCGALLYHLGYPWWTSSCLCASELVVWAIEENCGIGRKAAEFLKKLVNYKIVSVVETSTTMVFDTTIRNTYKKTGFTEVPSFFYSK